MYFKILEAFILKALFNRDEYKFNSKSFNPIKFFTILILTLNVPFTIFLIYKINDIQILIKYKCISLSEEISNGTVNFEGIQKLELEKQKKKKDN